MPAENQPLRGGRPQFLTTAWTVVMSAAQEGAPGADDSLAELCRTYWQPIYAFVRHQGHHSAHDAEDLTQEFFVHLLTDRTLSRAERARGRFRSFLLGALRRFLAREAERLHARKRGAGCEFMPLDDLDDDGAGLPAVNGEVERWFEARWAQALLDSTLAELRAEWVRGEDDQTARFDALRPFLPGGNVAPGSYRAVSAALGIPEAALKTLIHRLRARYRETLRRQVARTVGTPREVDEEIRHLCAAAARPAPSR